MNSSVVDITSSKALKKAPGVQIEAVPETPELKKDPEAKEVE